MKLIGYMLMTAALILGTISAMTSYVPKLGPDLVGQELNADAGVVEENGERSPLITKTTEVDGEQVPVVLTPERIAELEANGVKRVHVKSFELGRWSHWPYFALSVVMMVGGAMMVRSSTKKDVAESAATDGAGASPEETIDAIEQELTALARDLEDIFDEQARLVAIVDRVGDLLGDRVLPFFDMRSALIGKLGLAGFAGVMDRFSALERSLNRSWSAAADGHDAEAMASLQRAREIVPEVRERLHAHR